MFRATDLQSLQEAYQNIYEETDGISLEMIEEIVEELVEECVEYGYTLDEAAETVEEAATEYLMELNPYAPAGSKEARAYQKSTTATKRGEARKAAVRGAVERVKARVKGAQAAAGIAGSIAKDEARRAGRAAKQAVTGAVEKKKEEVKKGVKGLLARGLRAAAGAAGSVAQKARKAGAAAGRAAERLGEEVIDEAIYSEKGKAKAAEMIAKRSTPSGRAKPGKGANVAQIRQIRGSGRGRFDREGLGGTPMTPTMAKNPIKKQNYDGTGNKAARRAAALNNEEFDVFDVVLEYLLDTGHAETISEAQYIMSQMDSESIDSMLDEAMTNYEKNRKRAAQRAAARNEARAQGKTGAVPGVGYVTPRRERETWTDESGKTRHAKGL